MPGCIISTSFRAVRSAAVATKLGMGYFLSLGQLLPARLLKLLVLLDVGFQVRPVLLPGLLVAGVILEPVGQVGDWEVGLGAVQLCECLGQHAAELALEDEVDGLGDPVRHGNTTYFIINDILNYRPIRSGGGDFGYGDQLL